MSACPYLAFSTGKDSQVLADLVWEQAPETPAVYFDADCAFPESRRVLWETALEHNLIAWPCEPLIDTFERLGGPTAPGIEYQTMKSTVWGPIEELLKRNDLDGVFVGLRSQESHGRDWLRKRQGSLFWAKRWGIWEYNPLLEWTYNDVWAYIVSRDLSYNRAYDRMWDMPENEQRVSYWAGEMLRTHGRWAWLRRNYPGLYNQFIDRFPEVARYT